MTDIVIVGTWPFDIDGFSRVQHLLGNYPADAIVIMAPGELAGMDPPELPSEIQQQMGVRNFLEKYPQFSLDVQQILTLKQTGELFLSLARYEVQAVNNWDNNSKVRVVFADVPLSELGDAAAGNEVQSMEIFFNMMITDEAMSEIYQEVLARGIEAFKRICREETAGIYQMREIFRSAEINWRHPAFQEMVSMQLPHAVMQSCLTLFNGKRSEIVGNAIKELYLDDFQKILAFVPYPILWSVRSELVNIFQPRVFTLDQFCSIK